MRIFETWDAFKRVVTSEGIQCERDALEAEYLQNYLDYECSYFTEILPLTDFPDYIGYLPRGCIVRKMPRMQYTHVFDPELDSEGFSREEFYFFLDFIVQNIERTFRQYDLLNDRRLNVRLTTVIDIDHVSISVAI